MTKRQEKYNEIVIQCIKKLQENGYKHSNDLYDEWGDGLRPTDYILRDEIKSIKSIFREKSSLAIASLYFHLDGALDGYTNEETPNNLYCYTKAGNSIIRLLEVK